MASNVTDKRNLVKWPLISGFNLFCSFLSAKTTFDLVLHKHLFLTSWLVFTLHFCSLSVKKVEEECQNSTQVLRTLLWLGRAVLDPFTLLRTRVRSDSAMEESRTMTTRTEQEESGAKGPMVRHFNLVLSKFYLLKCDITHHDLIIKWSFFDKK